MLPIYVNVIDTRFTPAKRLVESRKYPERIQEEFAMYLANLIKDKLISDIDTQKRRSKWVPLSIGYVKYKQSHNLSTNIWEATGTLKESITVEKLPNMILVGIPSNVVYPHSDVSVLFVARCLEYGTVKMKARPLFRPTVSNYKVYTAKLFDKFISSVHPELLDTTTDRK